MLAKYYEEEDPDGYGASNPIRYRGYYWDSDIKMYYLMTRYYDPKTGRFINANTINYLKLNSINGLNLYAYCGNNPIMYVDPSGHNWLEALWNFLKNWYETVMAVYQQNSAVNAIVISTQNKIIANATEVAYNNYMFSNNLNTQSRVWAGQEAPKYVAYGVGTLIENGLKPLKPILNPENVHDTTKGWLDNTQDSSVYRDKYTQLGGKNVFEAMMEEFYGLE